jgi:HORMA domain
LDLGLGASVTLLTLYRRDLFPCDCFQERRYEHNTSFLSYEQFASGNEPQEGQRRTKIMVLKRGVDDRVDKLMRTLEQGAFDALKKNFLQAIQVNILERPDDPSSVLESWTFSFKYLQSSDGQKSLEGLTVRSSAGKITVANAQWQWQSLVRDIGGFCSSMGQLPGEFVQPLSEPRSLLTFYANLDVRFLRVMLFYTKDCDLDYEAPGFGPLEHDMRWYPSNENWERQVKGFGMMFSGYHAVTVNVSHMAPIASFEGPPPEIPANMEYSVEGFASDAIDMDMDITSGRHLLVKQALQPASQGKQKAREQVQATQTQGTSDTQSTSTPMADAPSRASPHESTQSQEGQKMAQALKEMVNLIRYMRAV